MKNSKWALTLLLILSTVVVKADFNDGMLALDQDDYDKAYIELLPLAETGDGVAADFVGMMYLLGTGVEVDLVKAYQWLSISGAISGDVDQELMNEIRSLLSEKQLAEANKVVSEWKAKQ